jgi:hypothetical protein
MLPEVAQMFALVRDLAAGRDVTEIAVEPALVQRHLLAPLAARAGASACRDDLVRATVGWARIERELPPVIDRLVAAGVRVAPIKGVAYAAGLYALPAERPMTDVDLLVDPYADAARVVAELGFRREPGSLLHHASAWVRGELVIDLHRGIVGAGRSRIDVDAVWKRARAGWPAGALRLEAADELAFHLVHMIRSRLRGPLIQVVDAARLFERCDVALVLERADEWRIGGAVRLALRYVRDLLAGAPRPGGWLGPSPGEAIAAQQPRAWRKLVFDVVTAGSPGQLAARVLGYGASRLAPGRPSGE